MQSCFIAKLIETPKMKKAFTEENNAIPPNFGQRKEVLLLVLKGRDSYDGYLKRAFKKNYFGSFVAITENELYSDKYSDKEKYRYTFDYSSDTGYSYSNGVSGNFKKFLVFDRLELKTYQNGKHFGFFAKAMKVYAANLEKKRKSVKHVRRVKTTK